MTVRVVDTRKTAESVYEVFYAKKSEKELPMSFGWPIAMQEVGVAKSEMYRSNKWQKDGHEEDYKHVPGAEGGSRVLYATPGFLLDDRDGRTPVPVCGPIVHFEEPMPKHYARLGKCLGIQAELYRAGKAGDPELSGQNVEIRVAHAWLGAATHPVTKEKFLFVYTAAGVHLVLTGPRLDIGKDGIER